MLDLFVAAIQKKTNQMKLKIQAQHLKPGDIVGSGEVVHSVIINSIRWNTNRVCVRFLSKSSLTLIGREKLWGKYTMINVERND
jgi:hypothetical protein